MLQAVDSQSAGAVRMVSLSGESQPSGGGGTPFPVPVSPRELSTVILPPPWLLLLLLLLPLLLLLLLTLRQSCSVFFC